MLQYYRREGEPNFAHLFNTPLHYEQGIQDFYHLLKCFLLDY